MNEWWKGNGTVKLSRQTLGDRVSSLVPLRIEMSAIKNRNLIARGNDQRERGSTSTSQRFLNEAINEFPSRLCVRMAGFTRFAVSSFKEADESGVEGPSKSSNRSRSPFNREWRRRRRRAGRKEGPLGAICLPSNDRRETFSPTRREARKSFGGMGGGVGYEKRRNLFLSASRRLIGH